MLKLIQFVLISFLLIFSKNYFAEDISVSIVTEDAYPLGYIDPTDSKIKGFSTEIIQRVMDDSNLNYNITVLPWSRAYKKALTEPNTLIYSIGRLPERENLFIWLEKIINVEYHFYTNNIKLINATLQDIIGLPVAVSKNSISHSILQKKGFSNFIFINNPSHASQLIKRNRVSLVFGSSLWFALFKKENPSNAYVLPISDFDDSIIELFFAMNPKTNPEILAKIRTSMKKFNDDGSFHLIINSY